MKKIFYSLSFILIINIFYGCGIKNKETNSDKLIVFHAGSLSAPFKQIKEDFMKENPGIEILLEPAGSVQCARKITDLEKDCDVMASADYSVIDEMLIPDYAEWNIKFAGNEMAIVYHSQSRYADEINKNNWYEILLREDVCMGDRIQTAILVATERCLLVSLLKNTMISLG